jgi:hypothetical protein
MAQARKAEAVLRVQTGALTANDGGWPVAILAACRAITTITAPEQSRRLRWILVLVIVLIVAAKVPLPEVPLVLP